MKKSYVKPELAYESFVLAQHIAGCNLTLKNVDVNSCSASGEINTGYAKMHSDSWFTTANTDCASDSKCDDIYCYTNGTVNAPMINS